MGEGVTFPLPSNGNVNELIPVEPGFFENTFVEIVEGTIPGDKMGLNGLPSLDGIGRMSPPFDGALDASTGVLVEEPCLFLVAKFKTGDSEVRFN